MFVPAIVPALRGYTREQFVADLSAGVIVGIVALPLAIAFAIASGVPPGRGLYTAIVAGFIISALGGSRVQIGGPTGAFVVIVYGIVQQYGIGGLTVATLMAGVILIVLGLTRMGGAIKFIPHPVVIGFTSGIAVVIFSSQVKDVFGLRMGEVPAPFMEKWSAFATNIQTTNLRAPKSDIAVLLTTFLLTVIVDLTVAIEVGMVLSAFLFIRRMAEVTNVTMLTREMADASEADDAEAAEMARKLPAGVALYEINGPFFFGAAERLKEVLNRVSGSPRVLVVRLQHVPAIDSTGLHALRELAHGRLSGGTKLVLADVHAQPMIALTNSGLLTVIGAENVFGSLGEALERAAELVSRPKTPLAVPEVA